MPINTVVEILGIKTEADLTATIMAFEDSINVNLKPLTDALRKQVLTTEVSQLELHMTYVESWRDRVARTLMLATALMNHAKSSRFLLPGGKNITALDRETYMKTLAVGAISFVEYLAETLKSIDSRVNLCKIVLRSEVESGKTNRFA